MGSVRWCLVLSCVAAVLAVRSHGPAHIETEFHAAKSQKLAEDMWNMQQKHHAQLRVRRERFEHRRIRLEAALGGRVVGVLVVGHG